MRDSQHLLVRTPTRPRRSTSATRRQLLVAGLVLLLGSPIAAETAPPLRRVTAPAPGSIYHTLIDGLRLIKGEQFDEWVSAYCHTEDLCFSEASIKFLKRYHLVALHRILNRAPSCLRGQDDTVMVGRVDGDPEKDPKVRISVECRPGKPHRVFHLKKDKGVWKFRRI